MYCKLTQLNDMEDNARDDINRGHCKKEYRALEHACFETGTSNKTGLTVCFLYR